MPAHKFKYTPQQTLDHKNLINYCLICGESTEDIDDDECFGRDESDAQEAQAVYDYEWNL